MKENDVLKMLRNCCDVSGSQKAWAKASGFSSAYISDVLNGRRELSDNLCKALGLKRVVTYEKARAS